MVNKTKASKQHHTVHLTGERQLVNWSAIPQGIVVNNQVNNTIVVNNQVNNTIVVNNQVNNTIVVNNLVNKTMW